MPILVQVTLEFRNLSDPDEVRSAFGTFLRAMVGLPAMDIDAATITEAGRFIGAFDDGEVIGGVDSYSGWLAVPGGARIPHSAVTHVGVLPTHRRRGVLSTLVAAQFDDAQRRGRVRQLTSKSPRAGASWSGQPQGRPDATRPPARNAGGRFCPPMRRYRGRYLARGPRMTSSAASMRRQSAARSRDPCCSYSRALRAASANAFGPIAS